MHIHIPYRNLMVEICLTNFGRKCISRIVGDLEMPVDASVVGIDLAVVLLTEKVLALAVSVRIRRQTNPFHATCQS